MSLAGGLFEKLTIVFDADVKGAIRQVDALGKAADRSLSKSESGLTKFANTSVKAGTAMVGASVAIGFGLAKTVGAAEEAKAAQIRLQNTLKNIPELANSTVVPFNNQAKALQRVTAASDEQITAAQAMLGTFHLTERQILRITPLVVDYARKFGVDLTRASIQVGKALDGQSGALRRNGVSIDEALFKTDRFGAVTKALREQVGGFAEREGKTFSGRLQILKNQANDLEESIGRGVVGVLEDILPAATSAAQGLGSVDEATGGMIGKFATIATITTGAVGAVLVLAGGVAKLNVAFQDGNALSGRFGTAVKGLAVAGGVVGGVVALVGALDQLANGSETAADRVEKASKKQTGTLVRDFERQIQAAKRTIGPASEANRVFADSGGRFREIAQGNIGTAKRLLEGLRQNAEGAKAAGVDIDQLARIYQKEAAAQRQSNADTTTGTRAVQDHTKATQEDAKALEARRTALLAGLNDEIGAAQAVQGLADTLKDSKDPLEQNAALLSAAGAKAQLAGDNYETLTGKTQTADQKQASFRQALIELGAQFPQLQGAVNGYLARIDAIPPRKDTTVTVNTNTAQLDALMRRLADATARSFNIVVGTLFGGGRAAGGPVQAGMPYLVGEKGPEIFTPKSGGRILNAKDSAAKLRAVDGGGSSGPTINIYGNILGGAESGRQLVKTIDSHFGSANWRS